jgi:hypothetical protein
MVGSPVGEESSGCAFSRSLGARSALSRLRRELDLTVVDEGELDSLATTRIDGLDSDYEVVTWVDRVPEHLLEGVAQLVGRMSTDTPSGDLSWQPEMWDAAPTNLPVTEDVKGFETGVVTKVCGQATS